MENVDDRFIPTGQDGVDISAGDSPERIEDMYVEEDAMSEVVYSKDLGSFEQSITNVGDGFTYKNEMSPTTKVHVHVETGHEHNYIHFEYEGGTGFSLRLPTLVCNAEV